MTTAAGLRTSADQDTRACLFGPLATPRKRALFAWICAAPLGGSLADPRVRLALNRARGFAGGCVPMETVADAVRAADLAAEEAAAEALRPTWTIPEAARAARARQDFQTARAVADAVGWAVGVGGRGWPADALPGTDPFLRAAVRNIADAGSVPLQLDPAWLTSTVVGLARLVRDGGAFELLPILADALEDAGCTDARVLDHCRHDGHHAAGCWVIDLLLG